MVDNAIPPLPVMPDPARTPVLGPNAAFSTEWAPYWTTGNRRLRNAYAQRLIGLDGDALAPGGVPPARLATPGVPASAVPTTETVFYVANGGSRKNNGLSPDDPWPDAQWAYMQIQEHWRTNGSFPVIELAPGTYGGVPAGTYNRYDDAFGVGAPFLQTTGPIGGAQFTGGGPLYIRGPQPQNSAAWSSVLISVEGATAFSVLHGSVLLINGLTVETTGPYCFFVGFGGVIEYGNMRFGGAASAHIAAGDGGQIVSSGNYHIAGAAPSHMYAHSTGQITQRVGVALFPAARSYPSGFAKAENQALIDAQGSLYFDESNNPLPGGAVTTLRASADWLSLIRGGTTLPGSGVFQDHNSIID